MTLPDNDIPQSPDGLVYRIKFDNDKNDNNTTEIPACTGMTSRVSIAFLG